MEIKQELQNEIAKAIKKLFNIDIRPEEIKIEPPQHESFGDLSTNIALQLAAELKKSPRDIAMQIVKELESAKLNGIQKIEAHGAGFINFVETADFNSANIEKLIKENDSYGSNSSLKNTNIIIEFTDPNPFKEFHIGHLYSNSVGESISRILEVNGANLKRADYFGDVGMHVSKTIWGLLQKFQEDGLDMDKLEKEPLNDRIKYLGQAYAKGATAFKEANEDVQEEMKGINKQVFIAGQDIYRQRYNKEPQVDYSNVEIESKYDFDLVNKIYKKGRAWSLEYFETIYKRVGTKFDLYYPESVSAEFGYALVQEGFKKGIFEKSDGATIFSKEKSRLHTRVFINALGLPTYEAKDLGLAPAKYQDFKYDRSIIFTGNEIDEYFKVVLKAMSLVKPELAEKTIHMSHGMVRLPEGKMSSRTGKIITGEWLLNEAKEKITKKMSNIDSNINLDVTAETLAIASIKYAFLKHSIGSDIAFDFDKSLSFEGDSGPYLEYTYARAKSILREVSEIQYSEQNIKSLTSDGETALMKALSQFPKVIEKAAENYAPNLICTYLFDLAQKFNSFYKNNPVLKAENQKKKNARLILTQATSIVIKNGLNLLGIKTVERM